MSRSAILAAAVALFCLSFPYVVAAQRTVPRNPIVRKTEPAAPPKPAAAPAGEGQTSTAAIAPGTGSIIGAVVDSLHDVVLAHAGVSVVGLPGRHGVTTGSGAFRIDSIPPGRYLLELTHPLLDSLGIRVLSDTVPVNQGQVETVELAIPSVHTVIATVCTAAKLRFGPGVILGRVIDADTDQPATGTEVSVAWTETEVSATTGIHTTPRLRKATVAADGTYRICGVPPAFQGSLQAIHGEAHTAEVPIQAADQLLTLRMLSMPPMAVAKAATPGDTTRGDNVRAIPRAVIVGNVTNAGGVPVPGARVSVQGSRGSTSTGTDGKFTLTGVMPGTQSVLVRRVGYSPVQLPIDVTSLSTNQLTVRLGAYTPVLSSVDVKAKADPLSTTGFERRRKMGMGHYMDLDAINKIHPTYTSDILRRMPGIYVTGSGSSANVVTTRGNGCVGYLVDGNTVSGDAGQSIDEMVNSQDVAAVEFYNPVDVPMELSSGANTGCAMLVIWTKGKLDQTAPPKP
ncbi:MAG TPA: carboxypeptidase regulatory-like domain-containing protein [Gemmatimonadaceae bacterium]